MRDYDINKEGPYVIEIFAHDKDLIIQFLTQLDRIYIYQNMSIVESHKGYKIMFREYNEIFWMDYPYWTLSKDMKIMIYDVDTIHILTQKEYVTEDNKDISKWSNIYNYTLIGNLEEDVFNLYKEFMRKDEFEYIDEVNIPKVKQCVLDTCLEILELSAVKSKRERTTFSDLKFRCDNAGI